MPIITERESNPRWGFLNGLGAASSVPVVLADPTTGAFSNSRFEVLKQILIDELNRAKNDYAKTMAAADAECGSICRAIIDRSPGNLSELSVVRKAAYNVRKSLLEKTKPRLELFETFVRGSFDVGNDIWKSPEAYETVLRGIRTEIQNFQYDANTLRVAADMSFYNGLVDRGLAMLRDTYAYLAKAAESVKETAENLAENFKNIIENVGEGAETASWIYTHIPQIILGGVVIFFVLPAVLKSGAAYKRSGSAAAFETAAGEIEGTRKTFASGARSAGRAVASGVRKAGTFAVTRNPSALLAGTKKRRVQRRRRR